MADFLVPINLSGNELLNARVQNLSSAPSHAVGRVYFDTTLEQFGISDGTTWTYVAPPEGMTDEEVQDIVGLMVTGNTETGITVTYQDGDGTIDFELAEHSADLHVDGSTNHVFTATDDTKLAGIATGATANSSDATLLARANHTGTQVVATLSDFTSAVNTLIAAVVDSAPGTLDTLNELAAALGDDPNFATTIATSIATKTAFYTEVLTGGATSEQVTHSLNTKNVDCGFRYNDGTETSVGLDWEVDDVDNVTVRAAANLPANIRIVVTGRV